MVESKGELYHRRTKDTTLPLVRLRKRAKEEESGLFGPGIENSLAVERRSRSRRRRNNNSGGGGGGRRRDEYIKRQVLKVPRL